MQEPHTEAISYSRCVRSQRETRCNYTGRDTVAQQENRSLMIGAAKFLVATNRSQTNPAFPIVDPGLPDVAFDNSKNRDRNQMWRKSLQKRINL